MPQLPSYIGGRDFPQLMQEAAQVGIQGARARADIERSRVSNFTELGRLKLQEQENSRQNAQEERAKALFPLVQQENQFKMQMAALNLQRMQQQWQDEKNAATGMADLSTTQNFLSEFNKWGTDEGEVALDSLQVKYPGIGKHPMFKEAKEWNANAAQSRSRIQQLRVMQEGRLALEEERSTNDLDVADANNIARIARLEAQARFASPLGRKFANTVKMEEYDSITKKLIANPTPENIEEFRVWKQINRVDLKEDPIAMIQKYALTEESKAIQRTHTGEIAAITKDANLNTAQKQQAMQRVEAATRKKLAEGRKSFLDAQVQAVMPTIATPSVPVANSQAEIDALPPNTTFRGADGKLHFKP